MDPTATVVVVVALAQIARLGSLALRLRCSTRQHSHQLDVLTALAARVSSDVLVELDAGQGGRLRLRTSTQLSRQEPYVRG